MLERRVKCIMEIQIDAVEQEVLLKASKSDNLLDFKLKVDEQKLIIIGGYDIFGEGKAALYIELDKAATVMLSNLLGHSSLQLHSCIEQNILSISSTIKELEQIYMTSVKPRVALDLAHSLKLEAEAEAEELRDLCLEGFNLSSKGDKHELKEEQLDPDANVITNAKSYLTIPLREMEFNEIINIGNQMLKDYMYNFIDIAVFSDELAIYYNPAGVQDLLGNSYFSISLSEPILMVLTQMINSNSGELTIDLDNNSLILSAPIGNKLPDGVDMGRICRCNMGVIHN